MFGRKARKYEAALSAAPLLVAEFGRYADDCLRLALDMASGQAESPQLTTFDLAQIETFRLWQESAPESVRADMLAFVACYRTQSMRFKTWIVAYQDGQRASFQAMTQGERDVALMQMSGGAVRVTLELRAVIERLWRHAGQEAVQPPSDLGDWVRAKLLYCGAQPQDWPRTVAALVSTLEN